MTDMRAGLGRVWRDGWAFGGWGGAVGLGVAGVWQDGVLRAGWARQGRVGCQPHSLRMCVCVCKCVSGVCEY